ncbi:hypothetical protein D9613_003663 [Agrocybe pediades]|uniref:F-box domain-containing protein n=1 Tax=Agrocybe pediades TaxID=84607 RepID=A0A8H4QJI2_9AGAR|nr:hypothetical protein D9613_003663 [Agrocybe pediades]
MGQTLSLNNVFKTVQSPYALLYALLYGHESLRQNTFTSTVVQHTPQKTTFQDLPNELLLLIFSFLELKPYIISHGVCKKWKQLLPLADIHPIRRRMFDLFYHMLDHPRFLDTRPWSLKTLQPFDRKAYIDALLSQYPAVPEEFRLWIMEWPDRMVPFGMWPGSPFTFHDAITLDEANGTNWLAYLPEGAPSLLTLLHTHPSHKDHFIPALLSWKEDYQAHWLIFAKDEPELFGRVIATDVESGDCPIVCRLPRPAEEEEEAEYYNLTYHDWLQFLEIRWDQQLKMVLALEAEQARYTFRKDEPLSYPVDCELGAWAATTRPTHPWISSCDDPHVLGEFQRLLRYN